MKIQNILDKKILAVFIVFAVSALAHILFIDLRPLHSDEGVNGKFVIDLVEKGTYKYNPAYYHGPLLYYMAKPMVAIFGFTATTIRFWQAVLGCCIPLLLIPYRHRLSTHAITAGAIVLSFSPSIMFYSLNGIHEAYLIFATIAFGISFERYLQNRSITKAILCGITFAIMVTSKETWVLTMAAFGFAATATCLLQHKRKEHSKNLINRFKDLLDNKKEVGLQFASFAVVSLTIIILLYSDFLKYPGRVLDIFRAYMPWITESVKNTQGQAKGFFYFCEVIAISETGLLLAIPLIAFAAFWKKDSKAAFCFFYFIAIAGIYSAIPYKTPWCTINLTLPLAIGLAFAANVLNKESKSYISQKAQRASFKVALSAVLIINIYQTIDIAFINYDKEEGIVYVQTKRDVTKMVELIDKIAKANSLEEPTLHLINPKECYPLPYLIKAFGFRENWIRSFEVPQDKPHFLITNRHQDSLLEPHISHQWVTFRFRLRNYGSNPRMFTLYIRKHLWERYTGKKNLVGEKIKGLKAGLLRQLYTDENRFTEPLEIRVSNIAPPKIDHATARIYLREGQEIKGAQWDGYIRIDESGLYNFRIRGNNWTNLYIAGEKVVGKWNDHPDSNSSIYLEKGDHPIVVESTCVNVAEITWTPPGMPEEVLPTGILFHKTQTESQDDSYRRMSPQEIKESMEWAHGWSTSVFKHFKCLGQPLASFNIPGKIPEEWLEKHTFSSPIGMTFNAALKASVPGKYHFELTSDDGSKLYIREQVIIDNDGAHEKTTITGSVRLDAGFHKIQIRYFDAGGDSALKLRIMDPNDSDWRELKEGELVSQQVIHPSTPIEPLQVGVHKRVDVNELYDFKKYENGISSARIGGSNDKLKDGIEKWQPFFIKYKGFLKVPETGTYTFKLTADDGARLKLGEQLIINNWRDQSRTSKSITINLKAGFTPIELSYYDVGGEAFLALTWLTPGASRSKNIPIEAIYVPEDN